MARYLKTEGRCPCGEVVPLRRLKDLGRVLCAHCSEVSSLFQLAKWKAREASRLYREAPKVSRRNTTGAELAPYLMASAAAMEAAGRVSEALGRGPRRYSPAQLRGWLAWARRWAAWGAELAGNVPPLLEAVRSQYAHGLEVVRGGGQQPEPEGHHPPALRLLDGGES